MSLREVFTNYRDQRARKRVDKLTRRLCQKYCQPPERFAAAEELAGMEGEEAIFALLQRFGVQMPQIIEDAEEKHYVFELVQAKGERAIPSILRFIREKESLVYPLKLLREIAGPEACRRHVLEALREFAPEYNRVPEKKIDLIDSLDGFTGTDIVEAILPFLADPSDDVVVKALEVLSRHPGEEERIRDAFLDLLVNCEGKPRVRRRILELFKDLHWKVTGFRKKVEDVLIEEFYLDKKGFIKRVGEN